MSKSTGNFLTLRQAIDKFSADGKLIILERVSNFKWFSSDTLANHNQEKTMHETNQEEYEAVLKRGKTGAVSKKPLLVY